jgi:hypothetical protein
MQSIIQSILTNYLDIEFHRSYLIDGEKWHTIRRDKQF